eukprot:CAMPEP_0178928946 /NCGR_PEP_ID=MMETSP0786-20121207/20245_1 /TAXON_ID=186022 /ORGANISM="Thalassionema frauenfeldii, Strain CCMP 1798" /LENGTH=553 /DNA_ID=CAMNT_0020604985 /DNA_START=41 /DNA_END=1702 /DNA_ORIENTATION=+
MTSMPENVPGSNDAKRQALQGQWMTPPLPIFGDIAAQGGPGSSAPVPSGNVVPGAPIPGPNPILQQQHHHHHHLNQQQIHQQQPQPHPHNLQQHQPQQHQPQQHHPQQHQPTQHQPTQQPHQQPQQHHQQPQQHHHQHQPQQQEMPLPSTTDDYAKALQEAYRRGAEAAARIQQQKLSSSCPNLQQFQSQRTNNPAVAPSMLVPNPLASAAPATASTPSTVPAPPSQTTIPQPMQQHHGAHHHAATVTSAAQSSMPPPQPAPSSNRSLSLPDMQSYAARAQAEEEKRKKRLARNRASARLRRLRKKNLVDSYEGEVGVLEASLQKLKAHTWGSSHEALLEALSMERGQQELSNEERVELIQEIVQQQRKQVEFLRETQREQQILLAAASPVQDSDDCSKNELNLELQKLLNLTESQKEEISKACEGLDKEIHAMETFIVCLEAMQNTSWLWNDGVAKISDQFTSILHPNQVSKFLIWSDANAEALDSLEYCHAPPSQAPPDMAPVFCFGMDDHGAPASSPVSVNASNCSSTVGENSVPSTAHGPVAAAAYGMT